MPTKAELEAENADLRAQLDAARATAPDTAGGLPKPKPPAFEVCAGVAADLEMTPKTVDPFTGDVVTGIRVVDGKPRFIREGDEEPAEVDGYQDVLDEGEPDDGTDETKNDD